MSRGWVVLSLAILFTSLSVWGQRSLTFSERLKAQEAIERVLYEHRIWPKENPGPKPSFDELVRPEWIERKALVPLKMSSALREFWDVEITPAMLQAELDRMERESRDLGTLHELFAALGNDPVLVAETLARDNLVEKALRQRYAFDRGLQEHSRRRAEDIMRQSLGRQDWSALDASYSRVRIELERDSSPDRDRALGREQCEVIQLSAPAWDTERRRLSSGAGSFQESETGWLLERLIAEDADGFEVESLFIPKRSFDDWWVEVAPGFTAEAEPLSTPSDSYRLPISRGPSVVGCDTWDDRLLIDKIPDGRSFHSSVWTGSEVIIWGGYAAAQFNTGGRYNPSTDTWLPTSTGANVPDPHSRHAAVWTGTEMIVWGGSVTPVQNNSGGRYNPVTDTWQATSLTGAAFATSRGNLAVWTGTLMVVWGGATGGRYNPAGDSWQGMNLTNAPLSYEADTAIWTGSEMIVWGGQDASITTSYNSGSRYDPVNDLWTPTTTVGAPASRAYHTAVWTGTEMIVWGGHAIPGNTRTNTGGRYNPATDSWTATTLTGAPTARTFHTAVWSGPGGVMIVWGGSDPSYANTGSRYNPGTTPGTDTWTATATAGAPSGRNWAPSVWTGTEMVVWGGQSNTYLNSGGRYNPMDNTWLPTGNGGVPSPRYWHTAVWTGAEMVVWGGWGGGAIYYQSGGRYTPATATWMPTSLTGAVPAGRRRHTAVWTGTEMIVWGGQNGTSSFLDTGGRYDSAGDTWAAVTTTGGPTGRNLHSAVWTGTQMIIWGGDDVNTGYVNSGSRYTPSPESWNATAAGPAARRRHTAVWTGTEMIVWGGESSLSPFYLNTGSRYSPAGNTWTATTATNAPAARHSHTAVWTGSDMVIWGGDDANAGYLNSGARYTPGSPDSWNATSTAAGVPAGRIDHSAIWTGAEMVVWGGGSTENTGGRYNPSTDGWLTTSISGNTPSGRASHAAVWTGSQMIVWGGSYSTIYLDTGGIYNLSAPASVADTLLGAKSVTVDFTWTAGAGATSYNVKRCTGIPCTPTSVVATPATNNYSEAMDGTSYFYTVEAVNSCGTTP